MDTSTRQELLFGTLVVRAKEIERDEWVRLIYGFLGEILPQLKYMTGFATINDRIDCCEDLVSQFTPASALSLSTLKRDTQCIIITSDGGVHGQRNIRSEWHLDQTQLLLTREGQWVCWKAQYLCKNTVGGRKGLTYEALSSVFTVISVEEVVERIEEFQVFSLHDTPRIILDRLVRLLVETIRSKEQILDGLRSRHNTLQDILWRISS